MTLEQLHGDIAWWVVGCNAATGLWCVGAHWIDALRVRWIWVAVVVAQVSIAVQVSLGVALVTVDDRPLPDMHAFYGFISLVAVAIMYAYRHQVRAMMYALYGFGGLFLMGLALRAITLI